MNAVGTWFDFRNPAQWRIPWARLYAETLDLVRLSEQLGFGSAWFSEHHFTDEGYLPSLPAALAAAAARTSRIRLGTGVLLAPLGHPLRLAEELAFLDQLSGGRIDVGLAPGYRPVEFEVMGVPHAERGARTNEAIEVMQLARRSARAGQPVSYAGAHYGFREVAVAPPPCHPGGPGPGVGPRAAPAASAGRPCDGLRAAPERDRTRLRERNYEHLDLRTQRRRLGTAARCRTAAN